MKKLLYLIIPAMLFTVSCSDDDDSPAPVVVNQYVTGKDLTTEYTLTPSSTKFAKETYFALGYGYDITGKYAHPDGIRAQVIDVTKLQDGGRDYRMKDGTTSFGARNVALGTQSDVKRALLENSLGLENINVSEGYKNAFNGIFNAFKVDDTFPNAQYYYYIQSYNGQNYRCRLGTNSADEIINNFNLSDAFLQDVNSLPADQIIQKYGTHVMTDVIFGWRRDYYYRSTSEDNLLGRQLGAMSKVLGSSMGLGIMTSTQENAVGEKENLYTDYVDGVYPKDTPNAWMFDVTNYSGEIKYDYSIDQTFDADNLVLIDWGWSTKPLIPIYEFISDATKKEAVKVALENYLNN